MEISDNVTATRTLLTPIIPSSVSHPLVSVFCSASFYLQHSILTQHQTTFFFSRILCHLYSETPPFLITAAFLSISDCLQHVKIGVPVASIYPISSKSGCHATPGHHFHAPEWQPVATIPLSLTEVKERRSKRREE